MSIRGRIIGLTSASLLAAASVLIAPAAFGAAEAGGNVQVAWSIPGAPASGLSNVSFPITLAPDTARAEGTLVAQQFGFAGRAEVGYVGLQPRPDAGSERLYASFVSTIPGTTSADATCSDGVDGAPGVTCSVDFDAIYGHKYLLTVERTAADTWTGTALDAVTGIPTHIGTYTLPEASGDLLAAQTGFVEYYLGSPSCGELPLVDVEFGAPTSTDSDGLVGTTTADAEYAQCVGESGYAATPAGEGVQVVRGFAAVASDAPTSDPTAPTPVDAPQVSNETTPGGHIE